MEVEAPSPPTQGTEGHCPKLPEGEAPPPPEGGEEGEMEVEERIEPRAEEMEE